MLIPLAEKAQVLHFNILWRILRKTKSFCTCLVSFLVAIVTSKEQGVFFAPKISETSLEKKISLRMESVQEQSMCKQVLDVIKSE